MDGLKVLFLKLKNDLAGQAYYDKDLIIINRVLSSRAEILSVYAHERAHWKAYKDGVWTNYHGGITNPEKLAQIGLKVERWIDREAEMFLYNYDRRVRYLKAYEGNDAELKTFLKDYYRGTK